NTLTDPGPLVCRHRLRTTVRRSPVIPTIRAVAVLVRRSISTPELSSSSLVPATLPVLPPLRDRASCGSPFIIRGGVHAVAGAMLAAAVLVERRQAHEIPVADTAVPVPFACDRGDMPSTRAHPSSLSVRSS